MRTLDADFITEKDKQENQPIFLYTLYEYDGSNNLYYTSYTTDITFDGVTYSKFPITHEQVTENTTGEIDEVKIAIGNVSRLIQSYLESYDLRGKKVSIKTVWANDLADTSNYIEDIYYIDSYVADQNNVTFKLTSKYDVLNLELPTRKYSRNYCCWKFKSDECGYSGGETECNKTLTRCRELGNQQRFGGFPSIPTRRIYTR